MRLVRGPLFRQKFLEGVCHAADPMHGPRSPPSDRAVRAAALTHPAQPAPAARSRNLTHPGLTTPRNPALQPGARQPHNPAQPSPATPRTPAPQPRATRPRNPAHLGLTRC
ncbi:hypothetical protein SSP24_80700 [Streptomyces spinoverrucosus]|uniref:Uncharacterized protein n=1 Tax=Streptomyces spinoverrucosus TaxID=284043 RepID=A0A4Y3VWA4_9ACTN|nr:hypothetical protein SSP24_80700 [Streptomyces spinoverrucosus]GHB71197.1 hypothetical protein GCM10010397_46960 [Streptomyces spinoverrucosus]